jgi:hypothetical protein
MPWDCWRSTSICPTVRIVDPDRTPDPVEDTDRPVVTRRTPTARPSAKAADQPASARSADQPASARSADQPASADEPRSTRGADEPAPVRTAATRPAARTVAVPRVSVPDADIEPTVPTTRTTRATPAGGAQPTVRTRSVSPEPRQPEPRTVDPHGTDRPGVAEPTVPTNIYRARRPVVAIFLVIPAVGVGLLLIHALAVAAFGKTLLIGGMIGSSLALAALPLLVAGLYGLITGAAHGAEQWGFKVWARPPLAYLVVGLAFVVAAGLAVRGV